MAGRLLRCTVIPTVLVALGFLLCGSTSLGGSVLISDWSDGTLQGWTPQLPFGGFLGVDLGAGNPPGAMFATDTVGEGGGIRVIAPAILTGDLSIYTGLRWDELVPGYGTATKVSTSVILTAADGTAYRSDSTLGPKNVWSPRYASFIDPTLWQREAGTGSFQDVVRAATMLLIQLETSTRSGGAVESWIDNVTLVGVPIPGDANLDGRVDQTDATVLATNWGATSADWRMGDFDKDGTVDPSDASILAANWTPGTSEATAAPEPTAMVMLLVGLAAVFLGERPRRRF